MGKNRNLEAKRIKRIKQIKARPRYLKPDRGYMKTGQTVNRDHVPKEARSLFEYRKRLTDQDERLPFITALMDALYPDFSKPVVKIREQEHLRLAVNKLEPVERKLLVSSSRYVKVALVSNRELNCFELIEYQVIPGIIRRSITYSSYDRVMDRLTVGAVRWKGSVIHVPNVEPAPLE